MKNVKQVKRVLSLIILIAVTVGCGPGSLLGTPTPAGPPPTPTREPSTLETAQAATVQVIVQGAKFISGGSGVIFDPSGLILTNNHVIEAGAIIKIQIKGQESQLPAQVVGKSPCDDLAVLKITTPGTYPSAVLGADVSVGDQAFAIGYPLGDKVQSLTSGIISKTQADGVTSFASIPHVLQTDAALNPGNSGGPLVTKSGEVIGINFGAYPGNVAQGTGFAIPIDYALPIMKELEAGKNLHSVGLNVAPVTSDLAQYFNIPATPGLFVFAVDTGSPAEKAGIQPGDVITAIEGIPVGDDGTLKSYCDILRSHDPNDVLNISAVRVQASCTGQMNGEKMTCQEAAANNNGGNNVDLQTVEDSQKNISTQVPVSWQTVNDVNYIVAAPDLNAWADSFGATREGTATTTGLFIYKVESKDADSVGLPSFTKIDDAYIKALLPQLGIPDNCDMSTAKQNSIDNGTLSGQLQAIGCTSNDNSQPVYIQILAYNPQNPTYLIWLEGVSLNDADSGVIGDAMSYLVVAK